MKVPPRRVLATADAVGGVWTFALELARGLTARGAEVLLAVIGPEPDPARQAEAAAIAGLALAVPGLGLEWADKAGPLADDARRKLLALERAFAPDLVHANGGFREAAAGFAAPVLVTAHSCVATWWRACRGEPAPADWGAYAAGVRAGLAAASAVVAPTAAFLRDFQEAWGPVRRPRVVRNGLNLPGAPAGRRRPVVLAAGRLWDDAKNLAALVAVAADLPWPVLVAGDPPAGGGVGAGVRHLGRLPGGDLRRAMAEAAVFAAPARYEPFGLAVLEAAASGCALVLGRVPSLLELWGDAALFAEPDDPASLRAALLELIEDPEKLRRLQAAARERSRAFGRAPMVEGYLAACAGLPAPGALAA